MKDFIFLDNNSTTPVDPRVLDAMLPYFTQDFANPASSHHFGVRIQKNIDDATLNVAKLINCDPAELIFTSGATESINLALKGIALSNQEKGSHIITVETEHKATLDTCKYLETIGFEVTYLKVSKSGLIDLDELQSSLRKDTVVVSIMWVNNETGIIQQIHQISEICDSKGVYFFTDATQAIGKISVDVSHSPVGMMAFSAHKFYGPKGVGCLYIRNMKKTAGKLTPIIHGGGHQKGLRSGTLNVPAIIGFGECCRIAKNEMESDQIRIQSLMLDLEQQLLKHPKAILNVPSSTHRIYNTLNIRFEEMDANVMIDKLDNITLSNGSACTSAVVEPSHVLTAIGLTSKQAHASLRISLGKFNTKEDINTFVKAVSKLAHN